MERTASESGDVRLGGVWSPAQRRKNDAIFAAATGALGFGRRLPGWALGLVCRWLGRACWAAWGAGRRRTERNLRLAFGPDAPPSRAVFEALGSTLEDTLSLLYGGPAIGPRLGFPGEAREVFLRGLGRGRGVVLAAAHLGPWERLGAALVEAGLPTATVARESYDPRFQGLYEALRERRGLRVLYRGRPGFVAALRRTLRANQVLGVPMDLGGRGVRSVEVAFCGGTLPLAVGPAELALRTGAALVLATPQPGPDGSLVVQAEEVPAEGDAAALTAELGARLGRRLRALPLPWPWMHRDLGPEGGYLRPVSCRRAALNGTLAADAARRHAAPNGVASSRTYVPRISPTCNVRALPITPHEAFVLSRVDGFSTSNEIGLITGLGDDVLPLLARLFSLGALLEPPPGLVGSASAAGAAPAASSAPAASPRPAPAPDGARAAAANASPTPPPSRPASSAPPSPRYPEAELAEQVDIELERKTRILELFYTLEELSHYEVLGVDVGADKKQIKAAYYALAQEFHPDRYFRKNVGTYKVKLEAIFKRVTEAHDVLTRNQTRSAYDAELAKRLSERPKKPVRLPQNSRHLPASKSSASIVPPGASAATPTPPPVITPTPPPVAPVPTPPPPPPPRPTPSVSSAPTPRPTPAPSTPPQSPRPSSSQPSAQPSRPSGSQPAAPGQPSRPPAAEAGASRHPLMPPPPVPPGYTPTPPPPPPVDGDETPPGRDGDADRRRSLAARLSGRWSPARSVPPPTPTTPAPATPAEAANARETLRRIAVGRQIEQQRGQIERYLAMADECIQRNDPVGASNAFRLAQTLDPNNDQIRALAADWSAKASVAMADHFVRQGDHESTNGRWAEAARSYVRAVAGRPDDPALLDKAARALVQAGGDLHQAADMARRAVSLRPQQANLRLTLVEVYVAANLLLNARRELAEASKISPNDERVKALLKKLG